MKIGVYICGCAGNISAKLDFSAIKSKIAAIPDVAYVKLVDLVCAGDGFDALVEELRTEAPDRIVIAACSPREHEETLHRALEKAAINPYFMQMVNIREQVTWVTKDQFQATQKACSLIKAAIARVRLHRALEKKSIPVNPDVMIIGAGPSGLSAALTLAEAGRKVVLVEKSAAVGGMPVLFDELFPGGECGPCLMQPNIERMLHGEFEASIELLTMTQLASLRGYFGNFTAVLEQRARYVDSSTCIGCGECAAACPASAPSGPHGSVKKAVDFASAGAMPHVPSLDENLCLRFKGKECSRCREACPVQAINYDDDLKMVERSVGAIIIATGASLLDCSSFKRLSYGKMIDVLTSSEFELLLSHETSEAGNLMTSSRSVPSRIAIVHCVGSLDPEHKPYCSSVCCGYALKFGAAIRKRLPKCEVVHVFREWCLPGQASQALFGRAKADRRTKFERYGDPASLAISSCGGRKRLAFRDEGGSSKRCVADMIVLCPAIIPKSDAAELARKLCIPMNEYGFFEHSAENHAADVRGIYAAGACRSPMDIRSSINEGHAAAGRILAELKQGGIINISPSTAFVDQVRCSGCGICKPLCPASAIAIDPEKRRAAVTEELCQGCGICVASCPAAAITGHDFSTEALIAEIAGLLEEFC